MREQLISIKADEIICAYDGGDYQTIRRIILNAVDELADNFRKKEYVALQEFCRALNNAFLFSRKEEEAQESMGYLIGYISGVLRSVEEFRTSEEFKLFLVMEEKTDIGIKDIAHINDILEILSGSSEIRHGRLAERIGIDKSTLTPIMDKLVKLDLVSFSRVGNRKYYFITSLGRACAIQLGIKQDVQEKTAEQSVREEVKAGHKIIKKAGVKFRETAELELMLNNRSLYVKMPNAKSVIPVGNAEINEMKITGSEAAYQIKFSDRVTELSKVI